MKEKRFRPGQLEQPKTIQVEMMEWKTARSPDIIETTGLGPCVGVIIYDPKTKEATVGHFVDPRRDDLVGMLREVAKKIPNKKQLKIYIGGGAPTSESAQACKETRAIRSFVETQLLDEGFGDARTEIRWQYSDQSTILRIDTASGEVTYDTETDD